MKEQKDHIVTCRAVGDGAGWWAARMDGAKGCRSGAASLARPGCSFNVALLVEAGSGALLKRKENLI